VKLIAIVALLALVGCCDKPEDSGAGVTVVHVKELPTAPFTWIMPQPGHTDEPSVAIMAILEECRFHPDFSEECEVPPALVPPYRNMPSSVHYYRCNDGGIREGINNSNCNDSLFHVQTIRGETYVFPGKDIRAATLQELMGAREEGVTHAHYHAFHDEP
jgi:hypothetical protein